MKQIDYYFWINSDWAYLGAGRLTSIADRFGAQINYMPVDLPFIYSRTGGLLLSQRAPERQAYRIAELKRWTKRLGIDLNFEPRFMCPNGDLASCLVIAAKRRSLNVGDLTKAILQAEWVLDEDISSPETLARVAQEQTLDASVLLKEAQTPEIRAEYDHYTRKAIAVGVFGSPCYVYQGELFWGQDRLDFLEQTVSGLEGNFPMDPTREQRG